MTLNGDLTYRLGARQPSDKTRDVSPGDGRVRRPRGTSGIAQTDYSHLPIRR